MATSRYSSATVPNPIPSDKSSHVYGEPHKFDPLFRGPVHRRKCTDVICCLVFFIVIFLYLALGVIAWLHGDPKKLIHPTNSYGQFCGQKGTHNFNKPILFYFNILKCTNPAILINLQCPTTQMCVSKCPDRFATFSEMQQQYNVSRKKWEYYRQFCKPEFNNPQKPVSEVLRDDDCPSMIYPSRPIFQRCVPDFNIVNETLMTVNQTRFKEALEITNAVPELQDAAKNIAGLADTKELRIKIAEDYAKSWKWILVGLLMSLAVSLVFIILLRFTAGLLLWITIASVVLLLAYGIWFCFTEFSLLKEKPGSDVSIVEVGFHTDLQVYLQLRQTWILMLVFLGVAEASITLMLISLRRRIQVAIALLREASNYLASSGEPVYKVVSSEGSCPSANSTCTPEFFNRSDISKYELCQGSQCLFAFYGGETSYHRYVFWFQLSNLLLFFWLVNFSLALEQCSLAGAFASYYWSSLNNSLSRFIAHCLKCCFWCLEKLICYVNHNAYIMMAIYGKSFCTSAREAFFLLMRNVVRVFVLDRVTDFLLFLGKLLVSGGIGVLGLFLSRHIPYVQEVPDLNFHWVPLLTVVAISYLIAHAFFSVYATCVDTLFLCLYRYRRGVGSGEQKNYTRNNITDLLGGEERRGEERRGEERRGGEEREERRGGEERRGEERS
ncbi:Choline transporter-like protein 5-B [Takifugu flavidus]|uniref:Choline transporter-like protein n=1 Tax=Takifugu flavidus TaxID=433684 RepID=A0A5C6P0T0_9TELE|nr:Choline transporter-like protein 5-B [Takifugu flavidus]